MATMDIIQIKGGQPANFLDVRGGVNVEQIRLLVFSEDLWMMDQQDAIIINNDNNLKFNCSRKIVRNNGNIDKIKIENNVNNS